MNPVSSKLSRNRNLRASSVTKNNREERIKMFIDIFRPSKLLRPGDVLVRQTFSEIFPEKQIMKALHLCKGKNNAVCLCTCSSCTYICTVWNEELSGRLAHQESTRTHQFSIYHDVTLNCILVFWLTLLMTAKKKKTCQLIYRVIFMINCNKWLREWKEKNGAIWQAINEESRSKAVKTERGSALGRGSN